jgi:hypothetical protein
MRSLKDVGVEEVRRLRRRTRRLLSLERVLPADAEFIVQRLDEVEARIVQMIETNERGEEVHGG